MSLPQFTATTKLAESSPLLTLVRALNSVVSNLTQIFTSLGSRVQLDSVLLPNVTLAVGNNTIPHTLGRTLTGWTVTRLSTASLIFDAQGSSPDQATYLVLVSSNACTVSLEVF